MAKAEIFAHRSMGLIFRFHFLKRIGSKCDPFFNQNVEQSDGEFCFIGHGWLKDLIKVGILVLIKLFILHVSSRSDLHRWINLCKRRDLDRTFYIAVSNLKVNITASDTMA